MRNKYDIYSFLSLFEFWANKTVELSWQVQAECTQGEDVHGVEDFMI